MKFIDRINDNGLHFNKGFILYIQDAPIFLHSEYGQMHFKMVFSLL